MEARESVHWRIRMKKEDSAFVYAILESYEGIASYSTLPFEKGSPIRDMVLMIPPDFTSDVEAALKRLGPIVERID